jgi:mRNA interferase MazF
VIVVQCDPFNESKIGTVVCVPRTSNLKWAAAPGNVAPSAKASGLPKNSVANVSLIVSIDKTQLTKRVGKVSKRNLEAVLAGIDVVLGK